MKIPEPHVMEGHSGGSSISRDQTAHMNNAHWLQAIERGRLISGELQHATKENPARFVALMKRIPNNAHQTYVSHVLWGLVEAEEVEDDLLKEAILDAHGRPSRPYGDDIAQIFEKHPQIAKEPSIFAVLAWYVENGEANEDETIDSSNTDRDIIAIEDLMDRGGKLHVRGINGARGAAAETMGAILWQTPEAAERAWEVLERRIACEPLISVRCCLMRPLVPLFNHDRLRCANLVERLVEGPSESEGTGETRKAAYTLSPLITH